MSDSNNITTSGGTYVSGDINTGGGDFVNRDKIVNQYILQADSSPLFLGVPSKPRFFLGRDLLVKSIIDAILSDTQTRISITGMPGVGKTGIAIAIANDPIVRERFSDGIVWLAVGQNPDIASLLDQLGSSLNVDLSGKGETQDKTNEIRNTIGQRKFLIVVDDVWNSEHAEDLLIGGPECRHLVTTRDQHVAALFTTGHSLIKVPELHEQDSFRLLQEWVPELCDEGKGATKNSIGLIYDLLKAVDGLPLIVNLLGGYLARPDRAMYARQFPELADAAISELSDPIVRLNLITKRLGDRQSRKMSVAEVIQLSLDLLPNNVQQGFFCFGAFAPKPATFSVAAAKSITSLASHELALLLSKNLLEVNESRLQVHRVLGDYAESNLDSAIIEKHFKYYFGLVQSNSNWNGFDTEYDQLRQAFIHSIQFDPQQAAEFAMVLSSYQQDRGFIEDAYSWCSNIALAYANTQCGGILHPYLEKMHTGLAVLLAECGKFVEAHALIVQAKEMYQTNDNMIGLIECDLTLSILYQRAGKYTYAFFVAEAVRKLIKEIIFGETSETLVIDEFTVYLMNTYIRVSFEQFENHIHLDHQSLGIDTNKIVDFSKMLLDDAKAVIDLLIRITGDNQKSSQYARGWLATISEKYAHFYNGIGKFEDALNHASLAMNFYSQSGDRQGLASVYSSTAAAQEGMGDLHKARYYREQALNALTSQDDEGFTNWRMAANIQASHATVLYRLGEKGQAVKLLESAIEILHSIGDKYHKITTTITLGDILLAENDLDKASGLLEQSVSDAAELNNLALRLQVLYRLGLTNKQQKNYNRALECFSEYVNAVPRSQDNPYLVAASYHLGWLLIELARYSEAVPHLMFAIDQPIASKEHDFYKSSLTELHFAYIELKNYEEALSIAIKLLEFGREKGDINDECKALEKLVFDCMKLETVDIAIKEIHKSLVTYKNSDDLLAEAKILLVLSDVYFQIDSMEKALSYCMNAIQILEPLENQWLLADAYRNLGHIYRKMKQQNSIQAFEHSIRLFEQIGDEDEVNTTRGALEYAHEVLRDSQSISTLATIPSPGEVIRHLWMEWRKIAR